MSDQPETPPKTATEHEPYALERYMLGNKLEEFAVKLARTGTDGRAVLVGLTELDSHGLPCSVINVSPCTPTEMVDLLASAKLGLARALMRTGELLGVDPRVLNEMVLDAAKSLEAFGAYEILRGGVETFPSDSSGDGPRDAAKGDPR